MMDSYIINIPGLYLAVAILFLTILFYLVQTRKLPPGPTGIPLLGYWPFLKSDTCHLQLRKMKETYGAISSFSVTGHLYINLGSVKALREAVINQSSNFDSRIRTFTLLKNAFNNGMFFINGEEWKILRKYFVQKFKERGFNSFKEAMCGPVYEVVKNSVEDLKKTKTESVDIYKILALRSSQVLLHALFGETGVTTTELQEICYSYEMALKNMTGPNLLLAGKFAKYFVLPFTKGYREAMEHDTLMHKNMYVILDRHKVSYNEANIRNIIDEYIRERNERKNQNDHTAQYFTDEALVGTFVQFIGDGITTVAIFICAIFRALLDHPGEQEKIYQEIIEVVGLNRDPSVEDKNKLPYTNAFILEVARTCDIFPFFPDLECTRETTIQGYRIPKGSFLLFNGWAAHFDPNEYEEPHRFNPSRYISKVGKKRPELPVLFGIGRRACMGEGFAMVQSFLFLTTIIKHFHLTKATDEKTQLLFLVGKLEVRAYPRKTDT